MFKERQTKIFFLCRSGEEEAMDHQVSPEPENGHSEEEEAAPDLENGSKADAIKPCSPPAKLFTFSVVNSYGTANISSLPCDGNILQLNRERSPPKSFTSGFAVSLTRFPRPLSLCSPFYRGHRLGHGVKEAALRRAGSRGQRRPRQPSRSLVKLGTVR